jgi:hypothetical protein
MSSAVPQNGRWRRIVTIDAPGGQSHALSDGVVDDVLLDPARPGFSSATVWATDATPAVVLPVERLVQISRTLEAPPAGSVFRLFTFPPDSTWWPNCTEERVRSYFAAAGSPQASAYHAKAPHPYMQQTQTLDLCVVMSGEVTLVLDMTEVALTAGDTVVQRGTRHAWSNRSNQVCVIAISSHDAVA